MILADEDRCSEPCKTGWMMVQATRRMNRCVPAYPERHVPDLPATPKCRYLSHNRLDQAMESFRRRNGVHVFCELSSRRG